jgi:hypothetical protein
MFSWNATVLEEAVSAASGDTLEKRLTLQRTLSIHTDPPGGAVLLDGKVVGMTPLYTRNASSLAGVWVIHKPGYDSLRIPPGAIGQGYMTLHLEPVSGLRPGPLLGDLRGPLPVATDRWPTYLSGAAMIVSGVASAYLKDQANREFDRYLLSKDPASLSSTRRLDRGAAITLAISQISFVVLSYLLLGE